MHNDELGGHKCVVQLCHKCVVKRWNESRLHSIWCTPTKTFHTICRVHCALHSLSTPLNEFKFVRFYGKSEQDSFNRKVYKQNNVADIQTWCWKRHIVAFLSFYFVAIFLLFLLLFVPPRRDHIMSIHGPFHLFDVWMASVVFNGDFSGLFSISLFFLFFWFCQNRWLCETRSEYSHSFMKHVAKEWKTTHISFSHRHKHNLIDTFLDLFVRKANSAQIYMSFWDGNDFVCARRKGNIINCSCFWARIKKRFKYFSTWKILKS